MKMNEKGRIFLAFLAMVLVLGLAGIIQAQGRRFKSSGERIYYTDIGVTETRLLRG